MSGISEKPDDIPPWGPKMLALPNDRQRAFVEALFNEVAPPKGEGLLLFAARRAGYGTRQSTSKVLSVIASRLAHDPRVQAAIAEFSRLTLRAISPEAILALKKVVRDPKHRDHMRAIAAIADRIDPIETAHTVRIEDKREPTAAETEHVLARIEQLMQRAGLLAPPPPMLEGDFKVVGKGTAV